VPSTRRKSFHPQVRAKGRRSCLISGQFIDTRSLARRDGGVASQSGKRTDHDLKGTTSKRMKALGAGGMGEASWRGRGRKACLWNGEGKKPVVKNEREGRAVSIIARAREKGSVRVGPKQRT